MWQERVGLWRRSGQTAPAFSHGKGFTASALRYWAGRLEKLAEREALAPAVTLARVVRPSDGPNHDGVALEIGGSPVRIIVRRGFDGGLLREVIEALGGAR